MSIFVDNLTRSTEPVAVDRISVIAFHGYFGFLLTPPSEAKALGERSVISTKWVAASTFKEIRLWHPARLDYWKQILLRKINMKVFLVISFVLSQYDTLIHFNAQYQLALAKVCSAEDP